MTLQPGPRVKLEANKQSSDSMSMGMAGKVALKQNKGQPAFQCEKCKRRFVTRHDLDQHKRDSKFCQAVQAGNSLGARAECPQCGKWVTDEPRAWQQHRQACHAGEVATAHAATEGDAAPSSSTGTGSSGSGGAFPTFLIALANLQRELNQGREGQGKSHQKQM